MVDCTQEFADSLLFNWSGHACYGLDSNRVGLEAICGDIVAMKVVLWTRNFILLVFSLTPRSGQHEIYLYNINTSSSRQPWCKTIFLELKGNVWES